MSWSAVADLDVVSKLPMTLEVEDVYVFKNDRSMTVGDAFSLTAGGVYFNGAQVEAAGSGSSDINISLDYDSGAACTHLGVTGVGAVTALNIVGSVYNQSGNVTVSNSDGGIALTGTDREY